MKRNLLTIVFTGLILGSGNISKAQGLYVQAGGGYGFGAAGNSYPAGTEYTIDDKGNSTSKPLNISLGQGLNISAAGGYMMSDNISVELGLGFLIGSMSMAYNYKDPTDKKTVELKASSFMLFPGIKIASGSDGIKPYASFGIVTGLMNQYTQFTNEEDTKGGKTEKIIKEEKYTGNMSFGFFGSAGLSYKLNDKMSLFAECKLISQSFSPKKSEIIKWEKDGADQLPSKKTIQKETEYLDEVKTSSTPPNEGEPSKDLIFSLPNSSAGINVGVIMGF